VSPAQPSIPREVLLDVAGEGARDAGNLPVELLGDFLSVVTGAVVAGRPITARQLRAYRAKGDSAARDGVALRALLDLYLSSAWRLWRHLPPVAAAASDPEGVVIAGEVMLHAVDDVVAAITEGYQLARRSLVRAQESARREFIDDLLSGTADVVSVLQRADGFGLDLSGPHAVAVIRSTHGFDHAAPLIGRLERAVLGAKGDAQALLATKQGRLVIVFPCPDRRALDFVRDQLSSALGPRVGSADWQIAFGRQGTGADGVSTSFREAQEALSLAARLDLDAAVVDARDLLVYRVLLRDRAALIDLVESTLAPLRAARGGPAPLLSTLLAYFATSGNSAQTARDLHMSVRAVTYRLSRIRELTGHDPAEASGRFGLHVAVLGAKLLDWPDGSLD
jgi:hypothetical protein